MTYIQSLSGKETLLQITPHLSPLRLPFRHPRKVATPDVLRGGHRVYDRLSICLTIAFRRLTITNGDVLCNVATPSIFS